MARSGTVRHRVSDDERAELEQLAEWVGEETLSGLIRRALDDLKATSGFNDRDVDVDAEAPEPVAAFVLGIGLDTEGDT